MYTIYITSPLHAHLHLSLSEHALMIKMSKSIQRIPPKKSNATMRCACGPVDYVATAGQGRGQARVARLVQVATCVQRSSEAEAEAEAVANCHCRRQLAS